MNRNHPRILAEPAPWRRAILRVPICRRGGLKPRGPLNPNRSPRLANNRPSSLRPCSRAIFHAKIPPNSHFACPNSFRISTSENSSTFRIPFILSGFKSTRINTSGNKDLKSFIINTSETKDLKSFRINTSKKQGCGPNFPILNRKRAPSRLHVCGDERSPRSGVISARVKRHHD